MAASTFCQANPKDCPLTAEIHAQKLVRIFQTQNYRTTDFKNECLTMLRKYKRKPGEPTIMPCIQVYQVLFHYFIAKKDFYNLRKYLFEILDNDPRTLPHLLYFLNNFIYEPEVQSKSGWSKKQIFDKILQVIKNDKNVRQGYYPKIEYLKIVVLRAKNENVLNLSKEFLVENPVSTKTKHVIELMRDSIDFNNPEQIQEYYKLLTFLIVQQPTKKENYNTIGFILKEKKRIAREYQIQPDGEVAELQSQWDKLCETTNNFAAEIQNYGKAYDLFNELIGRINNKNDSLDNLEKYKPIFLLGGEEPLAIYNKAYLMYRKGSKMRPKPIFEFLTNSYNINKFTIGNSYYFLGRIYDRIIKNKTLAFKNYLMTHKLSACLVFTANSYILAADILADMDETDNALALLAVDVPTYNDKSKKCLRHLKSTYLCMNKNDITNAMRHLQVVYFTDTNKNDEVWEILTHFPKGSKGLWNTVLTNQWSEKFELETIGRGISSPYFTPDDDLFFDALAHDWPKIEDVSDVIRNNRTLSNNIFPQKRREINKQRKYNPKKRREKPNIKL